MGGRRHTPDHPATGPAEQPAQGLLPADFELADLYGASGGLGPEEDPADDAVLVPPIALPPEAELVEAALAVPLMDQALKLARWTAPHRDVDELGELTEEEGREVARLLGLAPAEGEVPEEAVVEALRAWALALDLDLVELGTTAEGGHIAIPGPDLEPAERREPETVLALWLTAAGIVRELTAEAESLPPEGVAGESEEDGLAEVEEASKEAAELLDEALYALYQATAFAEPGQETVPLGVLAALLVVPEGEEPDEEMLGDISDLMVTLDPMLADLAELGVVEHQPIDPELFEEENGETTAVRAPERELDDETAARFGLVRLTPLGQYGVREWLLEDGYDAPLVGELAEGSAEALLHGITERANVLPEREMHAWISHRAPEPAARELLAAARGQDAYAPVRRLLLAHALEEIGEPARAAVREVLDDPELGGMARVWLRGQGVEVPAPERAMSLWTTVDSFAALMLTSEGDATGLRRLVAELPVTDNPASYFGELWRVSHPYTADVLEAIGELHLDRTVAKEARRAAFKARSRQSG